MSRRAKLFLVLGVCAALAAPGWILFRRQQDLGRARQFADQAARVRKNAVDAAEFFRHTGLRGRAPTEDELRAWQDRNVGIDAEARQAALRLRSAAARDRALQWLATQQALQSARVASRAIVVSRILFDYCTERQQFIARVTKDLAPAFRAAALAECFDQQPVAGRQATLKTEIERLEVDESQAWAELVALIPEIGR